MLCVKATGASLETVERASQRNVKHGLHNGMPLSFFSLGLWQVFYFIVIVHTLISVSQVLFKCGWGIEFHCTGKKNDP